MAHGKNSGRRVILRKINDKIRSHPIPRAKKTHTKSRRGIWSGAISFSLIHIPISVHPAARAERLNLDLLDKRDFAPVGYQRYNKATGKPVKWNDIVKEYQYEKDEYVVLTDEDFRRVGGRMYRYRCLGMRSRKISAPRILICTTFRSDCTPCAAIRGLNTGSINKR